MVLGKRGKNGRGENRRGRKDVKRFDEVDPQPDAAPVGLQWHDRLGRGVRFVPSRSALKKMRGQVAKVDVWLESLDPEQNVVVSEGSCVPAAAGGASDGGIWCAFRGQEESLSRKVLELWPRPEFEGGCAEPKIVVVDEELRRLGVGQHRELVVTEEATGDVVVVMLPGMVKPLLDGEAKVMEHDAMHHIAAKDMKRYVGALILFGVLCYVCCCFDGFVCVLCFQVWGWCDCEENRARC